MVIASLTPAPARVTAAAVASQPLQSVAIPKVGAYLGAWVNPLGSSARLVARVQALNSRLRAPLSLLHRYVSWSGLLDIQGLGRLSGTGAVPIVDWSCGDSDANVIAGKDDQLIRATANSLRSYGRPVMLRWYWEPNFPHSRSTAFCMGRAGHAGYVSAWQHIRSIFRQVGATNVAFVWCPGMGGDVSNLGSYYPGDSYVDWIAADGYDRTHGGTEAFQQIFGGWCNQFVSRGKPMMIAETGAPPANQQAYLQGAGAAMHSEFGALKALVYFDGSTPRDNWTLGGGGEAALGVLARDPYFTPGSHPAPPARACPVAPPAVTTSTLPPATHRKPYSVVLHASGGVAPLVWSLAQGRPPAGLDLSRDGVISGVPVASKTIYFTVAVTDSRGDRGEAKLSIRVNG